MKTNLTDLELVEMISKDNTLAFEMIYNRYSKGMFLFAMNIFKKKDICEDIVQSVFIDFWSNRKHKEIKNLKPYLFQSVKFQVFKQMRNQKMSNEDLTRLNIVDGAMNSAQKLEFDELEDLIEDLVGKLPPRCQQIFILSRFHDKSNKEIAEELGVSIQAVKNQISKALKLLKDDLHSEAAIVIFLLSQNGNK